MMQLSNNNFVSGKVPWNLAIVGGGRACKFFLELIKTQSLPLLNINLVGVCDIDSNAEGLQMARKMGIYTTDNFRDFFKIQNLDGIIELTNDRQVLVELIQQRPKSVGILEHNIGKLIRSLFKLNLELQDAQQQVIVEKMSTNFLLQQSNAPIAVLNTDFTIAEVNEAYLKMVSKSKDEALGNYCHEVYYGLREPCSAARTAMRCPMLETLKTGESAYVIHEFNSSEDRPVYANIVTYPLKSRSGEIMKVMEIWRDVTEEITARCDQRAEELKANLNQLVQEDRMISLGKLVASCVHEINNPLQGLLTFSHIMLEMLTQKHLSQEDIQNMQNFVSLMATELERCGHIVSGLLSFARETPLEYKRIDMNEILEAVISLTRHKMELQGIQLRCRLPQGMLLIRGDANRMQQCILNLIFNAIEAMPGGGQLSIEAQQVAEEDWCRISVSDSGCGIPDQDLEHIFEPFFTTKPKGQGTGLGLSIVYGVVKNHRGVVSVQSTVGKGTLFELKLPLSPDLTQ